MVEVLYNLVFEFRTKAEAVRAQEMFMVEGFIRKVVFENQKPSKKLNRWDDWHCSNINCSWNTKRLQGYNEGDKCQLCGSKVEKKVGLV